MIMNYPHDWALNLHESEAQTRQAPTPLRLARAQHHEEVTMYTQLFNQEAHIESIRQQRLRDARQAARIRIARGERTNRLTMVLNSIRGAFGAMLIATGERIRQEPVCTPESTDPRLTA